jgi:hypothetical protein
MCLDFAPLLTGTVQFVQDNWQTSISALSGTFFGAYLAFIFQRRYTERKNREANLAAAEAAQFVIMVQFRGAKNIKDQVLDPKLNDQDRHLTIPPFTVHAKFPNLDIPSLTFMLKDEGAQLLNDIMLAEHQFYTLIGALEERNMRHEAMQRRVSEHGPEVGLDRATVIILKDMTDSIFGVCNDVVKQLPLAFENLRTYIEKNFPETKALSVALTDKPN